MKEVSILVRAGLVLALFCLATNANAIGSGRLSADEIIKKAVDRAKSSAFEQSAYSFTKTTVREERDARGQIKERKQKSDHVVFQNGAYFKRSAIESDPATNGDNDLSDLGSANSNKRKDYLDLLSPELVSKYVFSLIGRTNANGRSVYEVAFQPRTRALPASDLKEKIANHAAGTLWIDESEFELVRAQIVVGSEISVGGFLGALKNAAFSLERVRLESGIWFERFYKTDYETRKLAQIKRVTTLSECRDFRRINNG